MFRFLSSVLGITLIIALPLAAQENTTLVGTTTARLNVRAGPGTGYQVVRAIPAGTDVVILSQKGNWCRLAEGTPSQWVHQRYLALRRVTRRSPTTATDWKVPWVGELMRPLSKLIYAGCPVQVIRSNGEGSYVVKPFPYSFGYKHLPQTFSVPTNAVRPLFNIDGSDLRQTHRPPKGYEFITFRRWRRPQKISIDGSSQTILTEVMYHVVDGKEEGRQKTKDHIVWHDGSVRRVARGVNYSSLFHRALWDFENRTVFVQFPVYKTAFFYRCYRFAASAVSSFTRWILVTVSLSFFFVIAANSRRTWRNESTDAEADSGGRLFIGILTAVLIGIVLVPSAYLSQIDHYYEHVTPYFQAKTLPSGHMEPIYVDPLKGTRAMWYGVAWVLHAFLVPILALRILIDIPFFVGQSIAYFHLIFFPHPAEAEVESAMQEKRAINPKKVKGSMYDWRRHKVPPSWKSRNWARRINDLRRRVRAESDLMKDVIDRERRRSKHE